MKYCTKCKQVIPEEATVCPRCGSVVENRKEFGVPTAKQTKKISKTKLIIELAIIASIVSTIVVIIRMLML